MSLATIVVLMLAITDFIVAICYACVRDWPRAAYWLFAGAIGITTIYIR